MPALPLDLVATSATSALPTPTSTIKYIALGLGTQNYTCNSTTGKYDAAGALARLFDATVHLSVNPSEISSLSQTYLDAYTSLECASSSSDCINKDHRCEDRANAKSLPILGEHYFTVAGTPTFDLQSAPKHPFLYAAKKADVPAPSSDDVDWLFLASNGSTVNNVISSAYRIETAGGVQPSTCSGSDSITVPYAAQYWYYI